MEVVPGWPKELLDDTEYFVSIYIDEIATNRTVNAGKTISEAIIRSSQTIFLDMCSTYGSWESPNDIYFELLNFVWVGGNEIGHDDPSGIPNSI